jgi:hypothetical protein
MLRELRRRTTLLSLLLLLLAVTRATSQEILFPDEEHERTWVASAGAGMASPFGSDKYSVEWNGRQAVMATLEYFPNRDASFGIYGAHTMYDHSGQTLSGYTPCMLGLTRETMGGGLMARVYAVRWSGVSLTLGGTVGALNVTRERPLLRRDGTAFGKIDLPSTLDISFGATFGVEAQLLPGASIAIEAGYEGVENQLMLAQSLVARTSFRFGL